MKKKFIVFLLLFLFLPFFASNAQIATSSDIDKEIQYLNSKIEYLEKTIDYFRNSLVESERMISSKSIEGSNVVLSYAKDLINYFLLILGLLMGFGLFVSWKNLKDIKSYVKNKINKIAKDEVTKAVGELRDKLNSVDIGLDKVKGELENISKIDSWWKEASESKSSQNKLFLYDKIISTDPNFAMAYFQKGLIYLGLENNEEALNQFEKAIKIDENITGAYIFKSIALRHLERHEEALEIINKALRKKKNDSFILSQKAKILLSLNKSVESLNCIDEALKINPKDSEAINTKAHILIKQKKYIEAIEYFKKSRITEEKCDESAIYYAINVSYCYHKIGKFDKAYELTNYGLSIDESCVELIVNKGLAGAALGYKTEAEKLFEEATSVSPNNLEVIYCQARMYSLLGEKEKALYILKDVIRKDESFKEKAIYENDFKNINTNGVFIQITNISDN